MLKLCPRASSGESIAKSKEASRYVALAEAYPLIENVWFRYPVALNRMTNKRQCAEFLVRCASGSEVYTGRIGIDILECGKRAARKHFIECPSTVKYWSFFSITDPKNKPVLF